MSKLDEVRALFPVGGVVECVENTYAAKQGFDRSGMRLTVERSGKTVCDTRGEDGKPFRNNLPTRVMDVVAVDDTSATWLLGRDDHTVTYRRVA